MKTHGDVGAIEMTFEDAWPEVSRRLTRLLAARGVPTSQRDDIVQETAVKLFRAWDRVDSEKGAWGLARTIAVHAIADSTVAALGRYESRELTELPDPSDPERAAIARFHLSAVRRALIQMSPTDRRVLLAEVGGAPLPSLAPGALRMARSRARLRLRALVEKSGSWLGVPRLIRGPLESLRRFLDARSPLLMHLADGAAGILLAVVAGAAAVNLVDAPGPPVHANQEASGRPPTNRSLGTVLRRGVVEPADQRSARELVRHSVGDASVDNDYTGPRGDGDHLRRDAYTAMGEAHFIRESAEREAGTLQGEAHFLRESAEREAATLQGEAHFIRESVEREVQNLAGGRGATPTV